MKELTKEEAILALEICLSQWTIVNKVDRKKVKKVLQIEWEIKGH